MIKSFVLLHSGRKTLKTTTSLLNSAGWTAYYGFCKRNGTPTSWQNAALVLEDGYYKGTYLLDPSGVTALNAGVDYDIWFRLDGGAGNENEPKQVGLVVIK